MKTEYERISHKFPYGIGDFRRNRRNAGIREAFKEDWYMTKQGTIPHTIYDALIVAISIPAGIYVGTKVMVNLIKKERLEKIAKDN